MTEHTGEHPQRGEEEELPEGLANLQRVHRHIIDAYGFMGRVGDHFEKASPDTRIKMRAQIKESLTFMNALRAELEMARERY